MKHTYSARYPKKLYGFSLTELAIVLGIIGTILGAIWVVVGMTYANLKISATTKQIDAIAAGVRGLYGYHAAFNSSINGEITSRLINNHIFPSDMALQTVTDPTYGTASRPIHAWNSYAMVTVQGTNTFRISYENVPKEGCINTALAIGGTEGVNSAGPVKAISTGSNGILAFTISTGAPLTPSVAQNLCSGQGLMSIEFDFNL